LKSEIWTAWTSRNDVYIGGRETAGVLKISLHESGVCNFSFSSEFMSSGPPVPTGSRKIVSWKRESHEGIEHTNPFKMFFILVNGGTERPSQVKDVVLLPDAPTGFCTEVAVFYSETDPRLWSNPIWPASNIIKVFELENGHFSSLRRRVFPLPDEQFQRILRLQHRANGSLFIGEQSPTVISGGTASVVLAEVHHSLGIVYVIDKVDLNGMMGVPLHWSVPR